MKHNKSVFTTLVILIAVVFVLSVFGQRGRPFNEFPGPAFDSGWTEMFWPDVPAGTQATHRFDHFLFDNPDNYVVDIQVKSIGGNPHNKNIGSNKENIFGITPLQNVGVYWSDLTDEHILVTRNGQDYLSYNPADYVRVRIWVYPD